MRRGLHSGRAEHREAAFACKRSRHGKEPGLADSRLAVQHERAAAIVDSIKQRSQQLDLGVPAEQRPGVARSDGHQEPSSPTDLQKGTCERCTTAADAPAPATPARCGGTVRRAACTLLAMAMPCRGDGALQREGPAGPTTPRAVLPEPASRTESDDVCGVRARGPTVLTFAHLKKEGSPWAHTHCGMSFSYTEDSSTAPVGRASTNRSAATASESASCRTRPCHCRATSRPPSRSSTPRTGQSCWSATPTAARSSPRPAPHPNVAALVYIAAFAPD